jgi:hypothetical protein
MPSLRAKKLQPGKMHVRFKEKKNYTLLNYAF